MTTFQLDTSGSVLLTLPPNDVFKHVFWTDLDPFTQGYVEALLRDIRWPDPAEGFGPSSSVVRFSDLAPATLARIMEIVAAHNARYKVAIKGSPEAQRLAGAGLWRGLQAGSLQSWGFRPQTPYLGDDGLIYLKDAT